MHRASGATLPIAPITHHWLDASHVTHGVITAGYAGTTAKFEASVFRGREPDERRWGFERPRLDSYALRLSVNPIPSVALQVSVGRLNEPEQLHPGADVTRLTASMMLSRTHEDVAVDATFAWGRNKREASSFPHVHGVLPPLSSPETVTRAVLAEATIRFLARHAIVLRGEGAQKDELFDVGDPRHLTVFSVSRWTLGYGVDVFRRGAVAVRLGAAAAWAGVPGGLEAEYGGPPASALGFVRVGTH
jgi:hypothetical protein